MGPLFVCRMEFGQIYHTEFAVDSPREPSYQGNYYDDMYSVPSLSLMYPLAAKRPLVRFTLGSSVSSMSTKYSVLASSMVSSTTSINT